jgi:hypothetical protein
MTQERFNDLGLLAIEKELCESLELSDVIDELGNKKARRCSFNVMGTFCYFCLISCTFLI